MSLLSVVTQAVDALVALRFHRLWQSKISLTKRCFGVDLELTSYGMKEFLFSVTNNENINKTFLNALFRACGCRCLFYTSHDVAKSFARLEAKRTFSAC